MGSAIKWQTKESALLSNGKGTNKVPRFRVILMTEKSITLNAIDEEDALEKAEARLNNRNNAWTAEQAYRLTKGMK